MIDYPTRNPPESRDQDLRPARRADDGPAQASVEVHEGSGHRGGGHLRQVEFPTGAYQLGSGVSAPHVCSTFTWHVRIMFAPSCIPSQVIICSTIEGNNN